MEGWLTPGGAAYLEIAEWRQASPGPVPVAPRPLPRRGRGGEGDRRCARLGPRLEHVPLVALRDPDVRLRGCVAPPAGSGKADRPRPSLAGGRSRREVERPDRPRGGGSPRRLFRQEAPRTGPPSAAADGPAAVQGPGSRSLGGGAAGATGVRRALPRRGDEQGVRPPRRRNRRGRRRRSYSTPAARPRASLAAAAPSGDGGAGGADVVQEWGVVKASLRQKLVIPAVARAAGAGGAFWKTDLLLGNPGPDPLDVDLRFVPGGSGEARETTVSLAPREIRLVPDVLAELFGLATGAGALFVTPRGDSRGVGDEPDLDRFRGGHLRDVDGSCRSPGGIERPIPSQLRGRASRSRATGRTSGASTSPGAERRSGSGSRRSRVGSAGPT